MFKRLVEQRLGEIVKRKEKITKSYEIEEIVENHDLRCPEGRCHIEEELTIKIVSCVS